MNGPTDASAPWPPAEVQRRCQRAEAQALSHPPPVCHAVWPASADAANDPHAGAPTRPVGPAHGAPEPTALWPRP